jgi:hypothetical protein
MKVEYKEEEKKRMDNLFVFGGIVLGGEVESWVDVWCKKKVKKKLFMNQINYLKTSHHVLEPDLSLQNAVACF